MKQTGLFVLMFVKLLCCTYSSFAGSGKPTHFEYMDFYADKGYIEFKFYALDVSQVDEQFKGNDNYVKYKVGNTSNWTNLIRIGESLSSYDFEIIDDDGNGNCEGNVLVSTNWCEAANNPSGEDLSYVVVRFVPSPDDYGEELTFRVTGDFRTDQHGEVEVDFQQSYTLPAITVPTNLSCSQEECSEIRTSWNFGESDWTSINFLEFNPYTSVWTAIEHRFSYQFKLQKRLKNTGSWGTVSGNITSKSYDDSNVGNPGDEYEYRVSTKLTVKAYWMEGPEPSFRNISGIYLRQKSGLSDYTMETTGKTKAPPPIPSFSLSTTDCDGSVDINWQEIPGDNIQKYRIFRDPSFPGIYIPRTGFIYHRDVTNGETTFSDTHTVPNDEYDYIVTAIDNCSNISIYEQSNYKTTLAKAPPKKPKNIQAVEDTSNQTVTISWNDRSSAETGFIIERREPGQNQPFIEEVDADVTSFVDDNVLTCTEYIYSVKAKNDCAPDGVGIDNQKDTVMLLPSGKDMRIDKLKASKGYYNNKVKLQWECENPDIQYFEVFRRPLGSTGDSILVERVNGLSNIFDDFTAEAGTFYEYMVVGTSDCNNTDAMTNVVKDIGYRSPEGIVNGKITYEGGIAVKEAKVIASRTSGNNGRSLQFNGSSSYVKVVDTTDFTTQDTTFTIEAWIKPQDVNSTQILFKKENAFIFRIEKGYPVLKINPVLLEADTVTLSVGNYVHLAAVFEKDSMKIYKNGQLCAVKEFSNSLTHNKKPLFIGSNQGNNNFFNGNIDEIRIWNRALSGHELNLNYTRIINPGTEGIAAMWHCDEGAGGYIYDCSYSGPENFNEHHGQIFNATFSNTIPTKTQLGVWAMTDKNGDYTITGIRYNSSGENFTIQPVLGIHNFDPANKVIYIGDAISIHNNIDFKDISAFDVSGYVFYHGCDCPAQGIGLFIDGEAVFHQGKMITTDKDGYYNIKVPIGEHRVSVGKPNHVFSKGFFPNEEGLYNFQDDKVLPDFIDSTYITVVGRVAGGDREGDKKPMAHNAANNIGKAKIIFKSELLNGCKTDSVITDPVTGNYKINLLPLRFIIPDFRLQNNAAVTFKENEVMDLSFVPPLQESVDTVFTNESHTQWSSVDTVQYNKIRNFIHYVPPELFVTLPTEDTIMYEPNQGEPVAIDVTSQPFGYPMFKQNVEYTANIRLIEKYVNYDSGAPVNDTVPVPKGNIIASNNIKGKVDTLQLLGAPIDYTFLAGEPNISSPFTKTLTITAKTTKYAADWSIEGIVVGYKTSEGTDFYTNGPDVVTQIIRDPPGDNSYAYIKEGSSSSYVGSLKLSQVGTAVFNSKINIGADFSVGLGMQVKTETDNNIIANAEGGMGLTEEGEWYVTNTYNEGFTTNASPDRIGAESDLFIGESMNYFIGLAENIQIMDSATCKHDLVECSGPVFSGYRTGRIKSLVALRDSVQTMFVYDEHHIINNLIPTIREVRNQLFIIYPDKYISFLNKDHPNYGTNNDDPVWGNDVSSDDPVETDREDNYGKSYEFVGNNGEEVDSIRLYNQQIRLWEEALAENERIKHQSTKSVQNVSFDGGPTYGYSHTSSEGGSFKVTFEMFQKQEAYIETGANVNGTGLEFKIGYKVELKEEFMEGGKWDSETTYGYTLHDDDVGDYFSVDVMEPEDGFGPVFKLRGGRSACPYEGVTRSKYYEEGGNPVTISDGTLRRDKPTIKIENTKYAELNNIPADEPAIFELQLGNESESYDDRLYTMRVLEDTNPNGARVTIDGLSANNREFLVPARDILHKELVVNKGAQNYDYENIGVVLYADCQFLVSGVETIADTVWLSVHFIPSCSDIDIADPDNQWVLNNSFNDTMFVLMDEYDVNYTGFQKIEFQYKPSSGSQWRPTKSFFYDTTLMGPTDERIPNDKPYTFYPWNVSQLPDGQYDLRAKSKCLLSENTSDVFTGIIDRINPVPFGTPSPGDGILSPNDDIWIRFNEPIYIGSLTKRNFDVRGVPNGAEQIYLHNACISMDGSNDYAEIHEGIKLNNSFTIEAWIQPLKQGQACFISQGPVDNQSIQFGLNSSGNLSLWYAGQQVSTDESLEAQKWYHVACSYDKTTQTVELFAAKDASTYEKTQTISSSYSQSGPIWIGASTAGNIPSFNGNIHDIRIWNRALDLLKIAERRNVRLSGKEPGLVGYWPFDEVRGALAEDIARDRHATIYSGEWQVNPSGFAVTFDGNSTYLTSPYPDLAFTGEMDVAIEFWFKAGNQSGDVCLLSTGKGDMTDTNPLSWAVSATQSGQISFLNNGSAFLAIDKDVFDNNWHHFALIINRLGNTNAYLDGQLQNSVSSAIWGGLGGAKLWIGARGWFEGSVSSNDQFFNGSIDELRIWNLARMEKQLVRDMNNRLSGDEFGLRAYFPFERYIEENLIYESSYFNFAGNKDTLEISGGATHSENVPLIKLRRPVENLKFTWTVNNDQIVLNTMEDPGRIENVTLDVTVRNIQDLHGNIMQSPKTWIAFVDKNQMIWEEKELDIEKELYKPFVFETDIMNTGGASKEYSIGNMPEWLTVEPSEGVLEPQSSQTLVFSVNEGMNIGEYEEDIRMQTDFGFDEPMYLNLRVFARPPDWEVDPMAYDKTMSIIGQIIINDVISIDPHDMVAAFCGDTCRGIGTLEYLPEYDRYEVFFDVYSNSPLGDEIDLKVWDASSGVVYSGIEPQIIFEMDNVLGLPSLPYDIIAENKLVQEYDFAEGWNWFSVNLATGNIDSLAGFFNHCPAGNLYTLKGEEGTSQYSPEQGWVSSDLTGLQNEKMYKLKANVPFREKVLGTKINPADFQMTTTPGWNWIGFIPMMNLQVNDAMAYYPASDADFIKGQRNFAIYDSRMGWLGSLKYMTPGAGYMLNSANGGVFNYPAESLFKSGQKQDSLVLPREMSSWEFDYHMYTYNMSMIACLHDADNKNISGDYILGAFTGSKCVGYASAEYLELINGYVFYLTIYADEENAMDGKVNFMAYNQHTGNLLDISEQVTFGADNIAGTVDSPVILNLENDNKSIIQREVQELSHLHIFPNPFHESVNIYYQTNVAHMIDISIFDITGRKVETLVNRYHVPGTYTAEWKNSSTKNSGLRPGVYFVTFAIDNQEYVYKLIKD